MELRHANVQYSILREPILSFGISSYFNSTRVLENLRKLYINRWGILNRLNWGKLNLLDTSDNWNFTEHLNIIEFR